MSLIVTLLSYRTTNPGPVGDNIQESSIYNKIVLTIAVTLSIGEIFGCCWYQV